MANMTFGVNLLPSTTNTYTLGNSDKKWNVYASTINGSAYNPLPAVSASDNGKFLQVQNGNWSAVDGFVETDNAAGGITMNILPTN